MDLWTPYQPSDETPWNLQRVVHLHRRAAFAAPWKILQRDLNDQPAFAIDRLLNCCQHKDEAFESLAESIGASAVASGDASRLKAWWIFRMLMTPDPLGERLTLMWHNHFATSNLKVDSLIHMHEQNRLMRNGQRGKFRALLSSLLKHPAMLTWLDADANRKGHPNENLARELMELFTLGIGNYTEKDVREAARALTGWTIQKEVFAFSSARHDDSEKNVLGRTANLDGDALIEHLCQNAATARRLAWRLCQTFLGEGVATEEAIAQLAEKLQASDLNIDDAVRCILKSKLFFSDANIRTRICGPVECIVGTFRALDFLTPPPSTLLLSEWASRMGQELFYPPNVGGWNEGRSWLSTRSIICRSNFAHALARGEHWNPISEPDWSRVLGKDEATLQNRIRKLGELMWGSIDEPSILEIKQAIEHLPDDEKVSNILELLLSHPNNLLA